MSVSTARALSLPTPCCALASLHPPVASQPVRIHMTPLRLDGAAETNAADANASRPSAPRSVRYSLERLLFCHVECCDASSSDDDDYTTSNSLLFACAHALVDPALLSGLVELDELSVALSCRFALDARTSECPAASEAFDLDRSSRHVNFGRGSLPWTQGVSRIAGCVQSKVRTCLGGRQINQGSDRGGDRCEAAKLECKNNGESLGSISSRWYTASSSLTTRTAAKAATSAKAEPATTPVYTPSAPSTAASWAGPEEGLVHQSYDARLGQNDTFKKTNGFQ